MNNVYVRSALVHIQTAINLLEESKSDDLDKALEEGHGAEYRILIADNYQKSISLLERILEYYQ